MSARLEDDPAAGLAGGLAHGRPGGTDFDAHEWSVMLPLALVGFFTNYDTGLLTLAAPDIAAGLGVSVAVFGIGVAVIRLAALGSVATLRLADRWGRRTMLLVSVAAFTVATGLTAAAWGLVAFVAFQLVARLFLATEETLAGVVLTEELRPDRRGSGIGLLGIISTGGFGLVAILLLFADATPLGWRLFYVVALVPLGVVAYLRRNLQETRAFGAAAAAARLQASWWPRLDPRDWSRLWRLAVLFGLVGMLNTTAFFYAAELAQDGYGWEGLFTVIVFAAAPTTLAGYVAGGRLSDRFGRKPVTFWAVLSYGSGAILLFAGERALYAPGFFLLAGSDAAVQAVRTAYIAELFPTEVRATLASFVGAVNVAAGSLGLAVVGVLAGVIDPAVSIVAMALTCTASVVLVRRLPETVGIDVIEDRDEPAPTVRVRRLSEAPALREPGVALVDAYLRLADAWGGAVPDVLPPVLRVVVDGFPGDAVPPSGEVLVAEDDGTPVGLVLLVPHEPAVVRLERMYVVDGHRGRGVGQVLLDEALAVAASLGHRRMVLDVMPERAGALRLYQRNGFTAIEPYATYHRPMRFLGRAVSTEP